MVAPAKYRRGGLLLHAAKYPEALKRLKPCKGKGHSCQLVSSQVRVRVTYFSASLKS